jgi:hypothetical protein
MFTGGWAWLRASCSAALGSNNEALLVFRAENFRMRARKVADVESSDMNMIKLACSRERARCKHDTSYDHLNLAAYVQSALGGTWRIVLPPALGVSYSQTFLSPSKLCLSFLIFPK